MNRTDSHIGVFCVKGSMELNLYLPMRKRTNRARSFQFKWQSSEIRRKKLPFEIKVNESNFLEWHTEYSLHVFFLSKKQTMTCGIFQQAKQEPKRRFIFPSALNWRFLQGYGRHLFIKVEPSADTPKNYPSSSYCCSALLLYFKVKIETKTNTRVL